MGSSEQGAGDPAPGAPAVRASDAERERMATLLREHTAAGRLTPEELAERLDGAYAARTVAELDALTHDLPAPPSAPVDTKRSAARERARRHMLHMAGLLVLVNLTCIAIWLASGAESSFWPKWVLFGTAVRFAFQAWGALGPGGYAGRHDEARHGRGGSRQPSQSGRARHRSRRR
jgi:hypothetical protein